MHGSEVNAAAVTTTSIQDASSKPVESKSDYHKLIRTSPHAMTLKIFRRGSARCIGLLSAFATILLCLYYISIGQSSARPGDTNGGGGGGHLRKQANRGAAASGSGGGLVHHPHHARDNRVAGTCQRLSIAETDITTMAEFSNFDFQVTCYWRMIMLKEQI